MNPVHQMSSIRRYLPAFIVVAVLAIAPMHSSASPAVVSAQQAGNLEIATEHLIDLQQCYRQISKSVMPVVAEINVIEVIRQKVSRPISPWEFFFGPAPDQTAAEEREYRKTGLGSGVIVGQTGEHVYVLTNNHLVGNAERIGVRLYDGRQFEAEIDLRDPQTDLALIRVETGEVVPVARLGDSDELQVGDIVLAVGNPFGFESTVTAGIVSAVGRNRNGSSTALNADYVQTDAAINPGNSGGALVNIKGEIIGINTWIASTTGASVGLGFAIPINYAKKIIEASLSSALDRS
jgi:serine protease Do